MLRIAVVILVGFCVTLTPHPAAVAQTPSASSASILSPSAAKVKKKVDNFGFGREVTVVMLDGREFHGSIHEIEADRFTLAEVALKRVIDFRYDEVKKVRQGFGDYSLNGQRVHPRRSLLIGLAVVGGLIGIAFGVAASTR